MMSFGAAYRGYDFNGLGRTAFFPHGFTEENRKYKYPIANEEILETLMPAGSLEETRDALGCVNSAPWDMRPGDSPGTWMLFHVSGRVTSHHPRHVFRVTWTFKYTAETWETAVLRGLVQ